MSNKDFERVIREDTRIALHKASNMKLMNEADPSNVAGGMSTAGKAAAAAKAAASKPSLIGRIAKGLLFNNPVTKAAQLSAVVGQAATGTETGRDLGKKIGDTFPAVKDTMSKIKDYRDNVVAPKLGMSSLSSAATKPYISNTVKAVKDVVAPETNKTELPKIDVAGEKSKDKPAEPKTPAAGTGKTAMSFKQAFAAARKEAKGGKGQFEYKGTKYQTNIQGTGTKEKPQEKFISAGKQKVTSVKVGSDAPKAPEAPKTPEAPKAPEAAKPAPETPKTTSQTTPQTPSSPTTSDTKSEPAVDTKVQYAPSGTEGPSSSGGTGGAGGEGGSGSNAGKGGDGGAGSEGGKGGKGGKGGNTLGECVVIAGNKYRIV